MTTHTPGPWQHDAAGRGTYMVFQAGTEDDGTLVCSNVKNAADAALLAAAPALLEALQRAASLLARYPKHDEAWAQARAAIAAATREAQP